MNQDSYKFHFWLSLYLKAAELETFFDQKAKETFSQKDTTEWEKSIDARQLARNEVKRFLEKMSKIQKFGVDSVMNNY